MLFDLEKKKIIQPTYIYDHESRDVICCADHDRLLPSLSEAW